MTHSFASHSAAQWLAGQPAARTRPHATALSGNARRWCVVMVLCCVGCGPRHPATVPVQGKVLFSHGKPVRMGVVEFYCPEKKLTARGTISRDGTFWLGTFAEADGAVPGSYQAIVVQVLDHGAWGDLRIEHDHGGLVDRKFADFATSGLHYTVDANQDNVFVIPVDEIAPRDRSVPSRTGPQHE